jgi:hypothetical protein
MQKNPMKVWNLERGRGKPRASESETLKERRSREVLPRVPGETGLRKGRASSGSKLRSRSKPKMVADRLGGKGLFYVKIVKGKAVTVRRSGVVHFKQKETMKGG